MTELGQEEILLRTQVTDLLRCKSVCKSWNSLISTHRFVKSHLNRHSNGGTRIFLFNFTSDERHDECELVGSSNGLVCISFYHGGGRGYNTDFLVVNPSTHEVKELNSYRGDSYGFHVQVSGFGYDSSIDDFKVVIGHRCYANDNDRLELYVLELKKNFWRPLRIWEFEYKELKGNGILCNGSLHWLHRDIHNDEFVIVSFDLSKEVFKDTPLPKLDDDDWHLGTMKDSLCIFRVIYTDLKKNDENVIWVMRNDQVSWERKLLPSGNRYKFIMNYNIDISLLEEGSGAPVLVQSIDQPQSEQSDESDESDESDHQSEQRHIELSTVSIDNYNYNEHTFVKSLVSPHGGPFSFRRNNIVVT